jgi:GNAT superfamily N-acetyltransferase
MVGRNAASGATMDDRVVRLEQADAERAGAALTRAFHDDPFHVHLFSDPNERDRSWLALYTAAVRFGCLYGESWAVTDPAWQRRGSGGMLVERFRVRAAADRVPTCLWTKQPATDPFYQRHGLEVVADNAEPSSGLRNWIFRRFADTP